ncbi:hypothetical protein ACFE04_022819 [Oxalis oulophora]
MELDQQPMHNSHSLSPMIFDDGSRMEGIPKRSGGDGRDGFVAGTSVPHKEIIRSYIQISSSTTIVDDDFLFFENDFMDIFAYRHIEVVVEDIGASSSTFDGEAQLPHPAIEFPL